MKKMNEPGMPVSRRHFLSALWKGFGILIGLELVGMITAYFISGKDRRKNESKDLLDAGSVDSFARGSVTAFPGGRFYLARQADGGFIALSLRCTHLGCAVAWEEQKKRFVCPCHSSAFDLSGEVMNPPATRPLDFYPVYIENGNVKVEVSSLKHRTAFKKDQLTYAP